MSFRYLLAAAALAAPLSAQSAERFSFVARLGVDTIAVETVERLDDAVRAEVLIRSPRTTLLRHHLTLDANGIPSRLITEQLSIDNGAVTSSQEWHWHGDSVTIPSGRTIAAPAGSLPFIDLVHWPFDHLLRELRASGDAAIDAPIVSGSRVSQFPLTLFDADSATVTHPTRGTMRLTVLQSGGIKSLDAGATTRALIVSRELPTDVMALARSFAARDATTGGMGELSGRGETSTTVHAATIDLDWGTPRMRGRDIWGALVNWGELWRTGANRATHFTTDRDLRFGNLDVPAGAYTLYSIPAPDGGTLIINRQTGQNGQQYDQSRDLGRVPLERRTLDAPVEVFTIVVREAGSGGELALQWANDEMVAGFELR